MTVLEAKTEIWNVIENNGYPSLVARIKAVFIDILVMLIIFSIGAQMIEMAGGAPGWLRAGILVFMIYLYDPIMVAFAGGTIGHYSIGLRVVSYNDPYKRIPVYKAAFRFLIKTALSWLSFITITSNTSRRAIHDFAGGSIVLYKKALQEAQI